MKYQIIIKDLENDEEILNEECETIIGGIGMGEDNEKGYKTNQIVAVCGNTKAILATLESAENAVMSTRKRLLDDIVKKNPDSPIAHLKAFFDSMEKQGKEDKNEDT